MTFIFFSTNNLDESNFSDVVKFAEAYPDFQDVYLSNTREFRLLLDLIGISNPICVELDSADFCRYWDVSSSRLREFNEEQFALFYRNWINQSKRDNNMDEYENLIFMSGISSNWNRLKFRFILEVRENPLLSTDAKQ